MGDRSTEISEDIEQRHGLRSLDMLSLRKPSAEFGKQGAHAVDLPEVETLRVKTILLQEWLWLGEQIES